VPICFIKEEEKWSQLIFRDLSKRLEEFIEGSGVLNKQKIIDNIQGAVKVLPVNEREKIKLAPLTEQIVVNKFVMSQLELKREMKTKLLFEDIKSECLDVVERRNGSFGFIVNETKLEKLIQKDKKISLGSRGVLEERLISSKEGVNMELLKEAIVAYAFDENSIEMSPVEVDIVVKQKLPKGRFMQFLKMDLIQIYFSEKNKIDYGINYKIHNNKLYFYGIVQESFEDKTIVVQITNIRHKTLKEIWIHGCSNNGFDGNGSLILRDETEARGHGYEIY